MKNSVKKSTFKAVVVCLFLAIAFATVYGFSKWQSHDHGLNVSIEQTEHEHNHERMSETLVIDYINGAIKSLDANANDDVSNDESNHTATTKGITIDSNVLSLFEYDTSIDLNKVILNANSGISYGNFMSKETLSVGGMEFTLKTDTCCSSTLQVTAIVGGVEIPLERDQTYEMYTLDTEYTGEIELQIELVSGQLSFKGHYYGDNGNGETNYSPSVDIGLALGEGNGGPLEKDFVPITPKVVINNAETNVVWLINQTALNSITHRGSLYDVSIADNIMNITTIYTDDGGTKVNTLRWQFKVGNYVTVDGNQLYMVEGVRGHWCKWQLDAWQENGYDGFYEPTAHHGGLGDVVLVAMPEKTITANLYNPGLYIANGSEITSDVLKGDENGKFTADKTYWGNLYDEGIASRDALAMCGVKKGSTTAIEIEIDLSLDESWKNYDLTNTYASPDTQFKTADDFGDTGESFAFYNFGFKVSGYRITCTSGGKTSYIIDNGDENSFTISDTAGIYESEYVLCLYNLIQFLTISNTYDSITIMPVWTPVKIDVMYYAEYLTEPQKQTEIYFGDNVDLSKYIAYTTQDLLNGKRIINHINGTTLYGFISGSGLVAINGPWNYLPSDQLTYTYGNSGWSITLEPAYASDVGVISLDGVPCDENGYKLSQLEVKDGEIVKDEPIYYAFNSEVSSKGGNISFINVVETKAYEENIHKGLVSNFVTYLKSEKGKYDNDIAGTGDGSYKDALGLGKVYYTSGTVENGSLTKESNQELFIHIPYNFNIEAKAMPTFISKYETVVLWKNEDSNNENVKAVLPTTLYNEQFTNEVEDGYSLTNVVQYNTDRKLTAINIKKIYLYYNTPNFDSSEYNSKVAEFYSNKTTLDISTIGSDIAQLDPATHLPIYEFGGWVLDCAKANKDNDNTFKYELDFSSQNEIKYIKATRNGKTTTFTYSKVINPLDSDGLVYKNSKFLITSITGDVFEQDDNDPIIKIKWTTNHNITFNTSTCPSAEYEVYNDYWVDKVPNEELINFKGVATVSDNGLNEDYIYGESGTISVSGNVNKFAKVVLQQPNKHPWAFVSQNKSNNKIIDKKYALYNYGHEIKGYYISFVDTVNNSIKYVGTSSNQWVVTSDQTMIGLNAIDKLTLCDLASFVDDYALVVNSTVTSQNITIIPVWAPAKIEITNATVTWTDKLNEFGNNYSFDKIPENTTAVTPYAYSLNRNNNATIAFQGVWNYYENVSSGDFTYDNGVYTVTLGQLKYSNNFVRVSLDNVNYKNFCWSVENRTVHLSNSPVEYITFGTYFNALKGFGVNNPGFKYRGDYKNQLLMDDYITQLLDDIREFDNLQGNDSELYELIIKESDTKFYAYIAHTKTPILPYITDELAQVVYWTNGDGDNCCYYEPQTDSITGNYSDDCGKKGTEWEFEFGTTFSAIYVYSVKMYYTNTETHLSVNTSSLEKDGGRGYFGNTILNLYDDDEILITPIIDNSTTVKHDYYGIVQQVNGKVWRIFEGWVINTYGLNCTENSFAQTLTVTKDEYSWIFGYRDVIGEENSDKYYLIDSIKGNGRFIQDENNPIITAKWAYVYDMTIDNSSTSILWNQGSISETEKAQLFGVRSSGTKNAFNINTIQIANADYFNEWKFMNSEGPASYKGISFLKFDDFKNDNYLVVTPNSNSKYETKPYYAIYNYGHYIKGYTVKLEYESLKNAYWSFDGEWSYVDEWSEQAGYTAIDTLTSTYLPELARALDEFMLKNNLTSIKNLTITPTWEKVNVVGINENEEQAFTSNDIDFNKSYAINATKFDRYDDKSIMAYYYVNDNDKGTATPTGGNLIAGNAKWNYKNISSEYYSYTSLTESDKVKLGQGTYTIMLKPVYVDNIYKVKLSGVNPYDVDGFDYVYELEDTDFVFNSTSGNNNQTSKITYDNISHDGTGFEYNYKTWDSSKAWVDDYVNNGDENACLSSWLSIYQNATSERGISKDGETYWFSCLRTVFYNTGSLGTIGEGESQTSNNLQLKVDKDDTLSMHICLVSGQTYGRLPMFKNKSEQLLFWKNAYSTDNDQKENKDYYVYKTSMFDNNDDEHVDAIAGNIRHGVQNDPVNSDSNEEDACIWKYSDGHSNDIEFELKAYYYRKYFYLRAETIQEELIQESNTEARRGYVVIELVDEPTRTGDDNKSGKYVFIYDYSSTSDRERNSKMVLYEFDLDSEWTSLAVNDKTESESIFQSIDKNTQLSAIPVYAGCSIFIHVIDQSQDVEAMKTGNFDDMIGYKFNGKIEQEYFTNNYVEDETKPTLFATEDNGYELTISSSDQIGNESEVVCEGILSKGYGNRSLVVLKLHFEKIQYTIDFDIDLKKADGVTDIGNDFYSGSIELNDQIQSSKLSNVTLTVEEIYQLKYIAKAGFKLQNNAFVLKINNSAPLVNLQLYNEDIENLTDDIRNKYLDASGEFNIQKYLADQQQYLMQRNNLTSEKDNDKPYKTFNNTLDGTWLREYFYSQIGDNYDVNNNDLGVFIIQTMPITFNFGLKIYDPTYTAGGNEGFIIGEDKASNHNQGNYDTIAYTLFNDNSIAYMQVCDFESIFFSNDLGFYYYKLQSTNTDYAVLNSRMYYPKSPTGNSNVTEYKFLLKELSTQSKYIHSSMLENMVTNYQSGQIIPTNDRNIFVMIEVRKLLTIDMEVEQMTGDPNAVERSTTVKNGDNNETTLTIDSGTDVESYNNGLRDMVRYITTAKAYTYYGLSNKLSSYLGPNDNYSDVEYYLNDSTEQLTSTLFELMQDGKLTIKFIPKSLEIEYSYYYNGHSIDRDKLDKYIAEEKPEGGIPLVIESDIYYKLEGLTAKHIYKVSFNNLHVGQAKLNDQIELNLRDYIDENTYAAGKAVIRVDIDSLKDTDIVIRYVLNDARDSSYLDEYGDIAVYQTLAGKMEVLSDENQPGVYSISEDGMVEVELKLTPGFYYTTNVYIDSNSPKTIALDSATNKIKLIDKFNPNSSGKLYTIEIAKTPINVTLNLEGVNTAAGATYKINNATVINNLHVNSTFNFNGKDVNEQRFDYYYYLDSNGNKIKLENVNINHASFVITSDLIQNIVANDCKYSNQPIELKLGVSTVNRVKAEFTIKGSEHVGEFAVKINGVETSLRKQFVEDGVKYITGYCDAPTSSLTFKLTTKVSGKYYIVLHNQNSYMIDSNIKADKYDEINYNDITLVMDRNYNDVIEVVPYSYNAVVSEFVYETLKQINDQKPTPVVTNQVNQLATHGLTYGENGILTFKRTSVDRALSAVYISGNDIYDIYGTEEVLIQFNNDNFDVYKKDANGEFVLTESKDVGLTIETIQDSIKVSLNPNNNITLKFEYILYKTIKF